MIVIHSKCRRELLRLTRRTSLVALAIVVAAAPDTLVAQRVAPAGLTAPVDTTKARAQKDSSELVPLFGWRDLGVAAGFAAATVLLFRVDKYVAERSQDKVNQANLFFKDFSKPSELIAWPGALVIGGGLYGVGALTHKRRVEELGWHGTEAVALAAGITNVLKWTVGRSRPYVSADTNPHDFKLLGGFHNDGRTSFPSGHTTTAFAAAAAVASEARAQWPHQWWSATVIPVALYGGATMVGLSRMYHNKHWASDVTVGAAIGTFAGIKVVQYTHEHKRNRLDRLMLHASVVPSKNGAVLAWSLPAP